MFKVLQGSEIRRVSEKFQSYVDCLKKNKDFLKQLILYYEVGIWSSLEKTKKIETYMKKIDDFRKEKMYSETEKIFNEVLTRLKTAEKENLIIIDKNNIGVKINLILK